MIDESEARQRILDRISPPTGVETVPLGQSLGRLLANDLAGQVDLPGFDNSAMDGYAVRVIDAPVGAVLPVVGEQPAGRDLGLVLAPGTAIRIFTGAPIPTGADAVIMQEDVQPAADGSGIVMAEAPEPGEWIRRRGADVCAGQRILSAGTPLTAARIGLLASQGVDRIPVRPRPRVGIVTTGDEVVEPAQGFDLAAGQLYNSNGPMLEALATAAGAVVRRWHAPDDPESLRQQLGEALETSDCVVVAGGVSVGERDFVKACLTDLGVTADFWKVRIKPGKPFLFGHRDGEKPVAVFGLPGNPVSAFVTWHLFVSPALVRQSGATPEPGLPLGLPPVWGRLDRPLNNPGDRPHYLRLRIDPATGEFTPSGLQQSHALFGLSRADVLLRLEPEQSLAAGDWVQGWRL